MFQKSKICKGKTGKNKRAEPKPRPSKKLCIGNCYLPLADAISMLSSFNVPPSTVPFTMT